MKMFNVERSPKKHKTCSRNIILIIAAEVFKYLPDTKTPAI
jgi:hypothetical protein